MLRDARWARLAVLFVLLLLAGCAAGNESGGVKDRGGGNSLKDTLHFAAVYVNDTHITHIPVPTITVTTEQQRPDWYLTLKPDGEARAIWTVVYTVGSITMPVNMEWVGTYTLNPLKADLKLQPAPKGWDTLYHSDDRYAEMSVTGELSADQKEIKKLVISGREAKSGSGWAVEAAPAPGDGR